MRRILRWRNLFFVLILIVLFAFPYGPLFPWSPLHPGYQRRATRRAEIIYPVGMELADAYARMDEYVELAEKFHRLPLKSRISVIICRNWADFEWFMPHLRGRMAAAVTLFTGTVIYVTPKVAEKKLDISEYLRHELSHAAIHQNQSVLETLQIMRQPWISEGLAVSFGEQKSYVTPDEFLDMAREQDLGPIIDPERLKEAPVPFNMRVRYQVWRYFLEYLIDARGRDLFQRYLRALMAHPGNYRVLFEQCYGLSMPKAIEEFQMAIRAGRWHPDTDFVSHHIT